MKLDQIHLNDQVVICAIDEDFLMKRRLLDLGFMPGAFAKCVLISPFHNPKAYLINGNVIALRNKDAHHIEVLYEEN